MERIDVKQYKELFKKGIKSDALVTKQVVSTNTVDVENRRITFICSNAVIDRSGDSVAVSGVNITAYKNNPVFLWQHNDEEPPIGKAVEIYKTQTDLVVTFEFIPNLPEYGKYGEISEAMFSMVKNGFLSAVSIGFRPLDARFADEVGRENGFDILSCELLEISLVNVPCNQTALVVEESIPQDEPEQIEEETPQLEAEEVEIDNDKSAKIEQWLKAICLIHKI